ncbi:MAG: SDR family oxidoreductase [Deltaproteobacteria bacterium]|nr:SDR family oxidoreductase [Deltaproteobacteria bacterium]
MARREGTGKTALVTGASAGIGRGLALEFASHGFDLVLVARSAGKLEHAAQEARERFGVEALVLPLDLQGRDAPQSLFDDLSARQIPIEVLVNNAGILSQGAFREMAVEPILDMLHLNTRALTILTRLFLEPMIQGGGGRVLNVASVGGFFPSPSMAVYAATKAYVISLSEALAEELQDTGVTVTALCAGFTTTEMLDEINGARSLAAQMPQGLIMDPDAVAREGYQACMEGEPVRVPGVPNQIAVRVLGWQPRGMVRALLGALGRRAF